MANRTDNNTLRELDANVKQTHKPSPGKRKKCDDQNTEPVSSPETKKRSRLTPCRTRSSSTPCRTSERPCKKIALGRERVLRKDDLGTGDCLSERLWEDERKAHVDPKYLVQVKEVTRQERLNVLNQIALIHMVEGTSTKTVFLATSIFDRFLSGNLGLQRQELFVLAFASFFVACKQEQFYFPLNYHLQMLSISLAQLLEMEKKINKVLGSEVRVPTAISFLRLFSQVETLSDERHYLLSKYILELSHRQYPMLNHYPSKVAAAAMFVSNKMLGREEWPSDLAESTGYKEVDLLEPTNTIISTLRKESRAFATNGIPCSPTTTKYHLPAFGSLISFALCPQIQEAQLAWSSSSPSSPSL